MSEEQNNETGFQTDVPDIIADDSIKIGVNEFPVFKCSKREFFSNMHTDRKRLRFSSGSKIQQYMQKTRYKNRDFYISFTDDDGKTFVRKIK